MQIAGTIVHIVVWVKTRVGDASPEAFIALVMESKQSVGNRRGLVVDADCFDGIIMDELFNGDSPIVQVWALLAPPVVLAIYFRFGRIWSLRNLDLALLLTISFVVILAPESGINRVAVLCALTGVLLLRLLLDSFLQRRPRIDTNVNGPGLAVLGLTGLGLIVAATFDGPMHGEAEASTEKRSALPVAERTLSKSDKIASKSQGPTTALIKRPVERITDKVVQLPASKEPAERDNTVQRITSGTLVVLGHLLVIAGLIVLGAKTFHDPKAGVAMAALYCLLPCTVIVPRSIQYILPSALILWAFVAHRRPVVSGILLGLACGTHVFPFVLIPLWLVYYGREGAMRFGLSCVLVLAALFGGFAFVSTDIRTFLWTSLGSIEIGGFWILGGEMSWSSVQIDTTALIATVVGLAALLIGLVVWPRQKSFADLLAHSVAILVAVFLWYSLWTDWFLPGVIPFIIVVAYRPKTPERVLSSQPAVSETPSENVRPAAQLESVLMGAGGSGIRHS